ncbi:MAG: hexokinase [Candidatus Aminicenantes bacterium]|nr:hexokinase [Candidatus Aminicenantes bacterium]
MIGFREKAQAFLKDYRLDVPSIDHETVLRAFQDEMAAGLSGKESSLAMIPTYISVERPIPYHKPVIAVDAGGTHVRVATLVFDPEGIPHLDNFSKHEMPGFGSEMSRHDFYDRFVRYLLPVAALSDTVGFCFSYPAEISPEGDGKLLAWTKEIKAPEVIGDFIGRNIFDRLRKRGFHHSFILLNDTVSTLLAGKSAGMAKPFASFVGLILGTGTNTAYVECNRNITKLTNLNPAEKQAINVESGNFNKCPRSPLDILLDAATDNPGQNAFEKMISGAYLGRLSLVVLKRAAEEHLLRHEGACAIGDLVDLTTEEVNLFLKNPREAEPFGVKKMMDSDRALIRTLCSALIDRAAYLTALNIAAAVIQSGTGRDPLRPVCVSAEGSTYHKTKGLRRRTENYLCGILGSRGVYHEFVQSPDASLVGAAIAGLTRTGAGRNFPL